RSNEEIKIYPNPSTGNFVIESPSLTFPQGKGTVQVYDVNGRVVLSQVIQPTPNASKEGNTITIDASALPNGIYNISLISNEGVVNKHLVIVR
ncbi:MAG: T9SS type A sorting domain-containing protein, partial [Bacteroidia bacterium]